MTSITTLECRDPFYKPHSLNSNYTGLPIPVLFLSPKANLHQLYYSRNILFLPKSPQSLDRAVPSFPHNSSGRYGQESSLHALKSDSEILFLNSCNLFQSHIPTFLILSYTSATECSFNSSSNFFCTARRLSSNAL